MIRPNDIKNIFFFLIFLSFYFASPSTSLAFSSLFLSSISIRDFFKKKIKTISLKCWLVFELKEKRNYHNWMWPTLNRAGWQRKNEHKLHNFKDGVSGERNCDSLTQKELRKWKQNCEESQYEERVNTDRTRAT